MSEKTHENAGADARDQAAPRPAVRLGDEQVLQLGDPRLRVVAAPCEPRDLPEDAARLIDALRRFRAQFGFGRAIAAPQLGIPRRLVALELGDGPFVIVDPVITWRSPETFTLWDDCMSFPELLVRVRRHAAVIVEHRDAALQPRRWRIDRRDHAELIQHELDHLDGVLAVDRAEGDDAIVERAAFERAREVLLRRVDGI